MTPDPYKVSAIIEEIIATEITPCFGKLGEEAVRTKSSPNDLVTIVDERTEASLRRALLALTPGAGFIGEEAAAAEPSIVASLSGDGRYWVVDPLDGTRNFVRKYPEFGTIVAFVVDGEAIMGWIAAIPDSSMAIGVRGEGAFIDGAPISPNRLTQSPPEGLRSTGWLKPKWKDRLTHALNDKVVSRPGHCSAYGYLKLLHGEVDFQLSSKIHPWDHVAGTLMLEEIGGASRWLEDASAYTPQDTRDAPLLITAPDRDWHEIARLLLD